jgi:hypothetical protein
MARGLLSTEKGTAGRGPQSRNLKPASNQKCFNAMLAWFLPDDRIFAEVKFHGNTTWSPRSLVCLALCWSLSDAPFLTDAFATAVSWCNTLLARSPLRSYTGFMGAMTKWSTRFIDLLYEVLQNRMKEIGGKFWQVGKWIPIAFDGSRGTAPRTRANEKAFCAPHYGQSRSAKHRTQKTQGVQNKRTVKSLRRQNKKASQARYLAKVAATRSRKKVAAMQNLKPQPMPQVPQVWITMLWHMGLRLPWMWRLGPSNSVERDHVLQMLEVGRFPFNTLFCGDAGFVGYPFWSALRRQDRHFMVRVGANVSLLTESADYTLLENGEVLCWPLATIRANEPPLRLRLVKVLIGKTQMWILTSVLDEEDLTSEQIVKFYKMRWGIEIEFRGLKQVMDRSLLRCRNDRRLLVELDWSIMAMAVVELFALKEQLSKTMRTHPKRNRSQPPYTPVKRSLANALRVLRGCLTHLDEIPTPGADLPNLLRNAVTDSYLRTSSKKARHRPPNKDHKPLGDPKLRILTLREKTKLHVISEKRAA